MTQVITGQSVFALVDGHRMHVYQTGIEIGPKLVFMSGSGTVSPVHDFKILYQELAAICKIIVIEKFGYGQSDLYESSTDIDSVISFQRQALTAAGVEGPYILVPHSMSGLEAIRWKQLYPQEVKAIIGLDMATPQTYQEWNPDTVARRIRFIGRMRKCLDLGLLFWMPLSTIGLDRQEIRLQRQLWKRNAFNKCYINEAQSLIQNIRTVQSAGPISCPILMFISNGKQVSPGWIDNSMQFARQMNAQTVSLNCGHYVHHYESRFISLEIEKFISSIR